jgi:RimJ/RimL family protein N-acetyltransferase
MNPRLLLETNHYYLRLPHPEDLRAVHLAVQMSLPELARWMPRALKGQTQRQTRDMIYSQMALFVQDDNYQFGIFGKTSNACLGLIELMPRVPKLPSFELGFWTRSDTAGRGVMTEAALFLSAYAFDKMKAKRVFLRCEPANLGSRRVAAKCGYIEEGRLRNDALSVDNHTPVDTLVLAHTPDTWQTFSRGLGRTLGKKE